MIVMRRMNEHGYSIDKSSQILLLDRALLCDKIDEGLSLARLFVEMNLLATAAPAVNSDDGAGEQPEFFSKKCLSTIFEFVAQKGSWNDQVWFIHLLLTQRYNRNQTLHDLHSDKYEPLNRLMRHIILNNNCISDRNYRRLVAGVANSSYSNCEHVWQAITLVSQQGLLSPFIIGDFITYLTTLTASTPAAASNSIFHGLMLLNMFLDRAGKSPIPFTLFHSLVRFSHPASEYASSDPSTPESHLHQFEEIYNSFHPSAIHASSTDPTMRVFNAMLSTVASLERKNHEYFLTFVQALQHGPQNPRFLPPLSTFASLFTQICNTASDLSSPSDFLQHLSTQQLLPVFPSDAPPSTVEDTYDDDSDSRMSTSLINKWLQTLARYDAYSHLDSALALIRHHRIPINDDSLYYIQRIKANNAHKA